MSNIAFHKLINKSYKAGILHVASKVAKPDVIASISKEEAKGFSSIPDHPVGGGGEESMLEKYLVEKSETGEVQPKSLFL